MHTPRTGDEANTNTEPELLSDEELAHLHELDAYDLPPLGEYDDWIDISALPPLPDPPADRLDDADDSDAS
jgi:hypothetical protein